jgi:hypothetical protein
MHKTESALISLEDNARQVLMQLYAIQYTISNTVFWLQLWQDNTRTNRQHLLSCRNVKVTLCNILYFLQYLMHCFLKRKKDKNWGACLIHNKADTHLIPRATTHNFLFLSCPYPCAATVYEWMLICQVLCAFFWTWVFKACISMVSEKKK